MVAKLKKNPRIWFFTSMTFLGEHFCREISYVTCTMAKRIQTPNFTCTEYLSKSPKFYCLKNHPTFHKAESTQVFTLLVLGNRKDSVKARCLGIQSAAVLPCLTQRVENLVVFQVLYCNTLIVTMTCSNSTNSYIINIQNSFPSNRYAGIFCFVLFCL